MGQTVNLLVFTFGGSNPSPPTPFAAIAQLVEHDLAKVGVASSSLVCRSTRCVSSVWLEYMPVTHGVTGSSPVRTAKAFPSREGFFVLYGLSPVTPGHGSWQGKRRLRRRARAPYKKQQPPSREAVALLLHDFAVALLSDLGEALAPCVWGTDDTDNQGDKQ